MEIEIRKAAPSESEVLTRIAHAAKRYWQYPEEYVSLWRDELTVTPEFIRTHAVYCAVQETEILGFYALSGHRTKRELEHLWVAPKHMRKGVGTKLFDHAVATVRSGGGRIVRIVADPNAEEFYLVLGARRVGEVPSRPKGRTLPVLELTIS